MANRWTRVVGDGIAYQGPCVLKTVVFRPVTNKHYVKVYDGRDANSGKIFAQFDGAAVYTHVYNFGEGAFFDRGIYIDAEGSDDETTVIFETVVE